MKENILHSEIIPIIKGVLITYALLLLLSLLAGAIAYFTGMKSALYHTCGAICIIIALFGGGFFAARAGFSRGWLKGICVGLICALIMLLISSAAPISARIAVTNSIYFMIAAAIGGIVGVK